MGLPTSPRNREMFSVFHQIVAQTITLPSVFKCTCHMPLLHIRSYFKTHCHMVMARDEPMEDSRVLALRCSQAGVI